MRRLCAESQVTESVSVESEVENTEHYEALPLETESHQEAEELFFYTALTEDIRQRIMGKSYPDTEEPLQISYDDLAYVHVLYYDFDAQIQEGS